MKIKRARGHRLYTVDGKKILDLSMDKGRAILGHRPGGVSLVIKNVIDRGLYSAYDSVFADRLKKEISRRFPDYPNIYILRNEDRLTIRKGVEIKDPLFEDCENTEIAYWRPFIDTPNADQLILLYPLPGLNDTTLLVSKSELELDEDEVSPLLLSGILRSFYELDRAEKSFDPDNYSGFRKIIDADFRAPYLILRRSNKEYKNLCCRALNEGILLNREKPLIILPPDYSDGEIKKILSLLSKE